jgi:hypothetical protein
MNKPVKKPLKLSRETVRQLNQGELEQAAGGIRIRPTLYTFCRCLLTPTCVCTFNTNC